MRATSRANLIHKNDPAKGSPFSGPSLFSIMFGHHSGAHGNQQGLHILAAVQYQSKNENEKM